MRLIIKNNMFNINKIIKAYKDHEKQLRQLYKLIPKNNIMLNRKLKQRVKELEKECESLRDYIVYCDDRISNLEHPAKYKSGFEFEKDGLKCVIISNVGRCLRANIDAFLYKSWEYEYFNGKEKLTILEPELDKLIKKD